MKLRDQYDWIALGNDPGALLSANLAAKLGLSVLILPVPSGVSLRAAHAVGANEETCLDLESNFVTGLGQSGLWDICLGHAGMTAQERAQIQSQSFPCQVLSPSHRVSVESDRSRLSAELNRDFPSGHALFQGLIEALKLADPAIERFWAHRPQSLTISMKPDGKGKTSPVYEFDVGKVSDQLLRASGREKAETKLWLSRKLRLSDVVAKFPELALEDFFQGVQTEATSVQGSLSLSAFSLVHQLSLSKSGASFTGGIGAFREFLLRLARRNGVDMPAKTECRQIFIQNGKFAGVLPSIRGSMIGATGGIIGCPLDQVRPMLVQSGRSLLRGFQKTSKPMGWKLTVALNLHAEAVPPGMSRRVIWQEKGAPFIEVERIQPGDYGLKDRQKVIVLLRTVLPMTEESLRPDYQRMIAARMLRKATDISPFLEYHIQKIYPDFRTENRRELDEVYGFKSLAEIPAELLCYQGEGTGAQSGVEGLFLSSQECFPDMGMQGGAVSALEGVAWLAHRSGLNGPVSS